MIRSRRESRVSHSGSVARHLAILLCLLPLVGHAAPPYSGTIFLDPDIITASDPSVFGNIVYTGTGARLMFDRRVNAFVTYTAFLFNATFTDGSSIEAQVNPEFGSAAAAAIEAEKYARATGQLPKALRADVRTLWIHKGVQPFGGGNNNLLIHTGQADLYIASGILEETLVHEASHSSLDAAHRSSSGWLGAQVADGEFISTYARDNPTREDVAESFLPWLAVRHRRDRIADTLAGTITSTIPNRLRYFDAQAFNLFPLSEDGIGPSITTHPSSQTITAGQTAQFAVAASGTPSPAYQWQVSADGGASFTSLTNVAPYGGVTTMILAVTAAPAGLNGYQYRAVASNSGGTATSNPATLTVSPVVTPCTMSISPTSASVSSTGGSGSVAVTASAPSCAWTAVSNAAFLTVTTGTSGTGTGTVGYSISSNQGPSRSGTITIAGLTYTLHQASATNNPAFGTLDTPLNNTLGLSGSIAVTGWALDDIEVTEVQIWRDPHPSDPPGAIVGGRVFVGYASLVNGARPDVETLYPNHPFKSRAGWGYLLLTRGLIWDGKGPFKLYAIAKDKEGQLTQLGSSTISIDNATATKPFGAIDTPGQGVTASGMYPNTGWVLTPNGGATIPADKLQVAVDGVFVTGTPSMSDRADINAGFPQFNTTGSGRGLFIDTTKFSDGAHTIGWLVTDSTGKADGVGSRYFTVANGTSAMRIAEREATAGEIDALPIDGTALRVRTGWDVDAQPGWREADRNGRIVVEGRELDRLEVRLDEAVSAGWRGYLRVAGTLRPLPAGSHLAEDGTFTWQPAVGFVGAYDLVFLRATGEGHLAARREIRVTLGPGR
jgi:hypothetical protein